MNPYVGIISYLITTVLVWLSIKQAIKNDTRVLPENGDFIVFVFVGVMSVFFPGYWLFFMLLWTLLIVGASMAINKGWWRPILLVPLFAGFIIFGGLSLPVFWW